MKNALIYIIMAGLLISLIGWHASAQERIVIDGKKEDWKGIEPMVTDLKDAGNERANLDIKTIYATLDKKNLYLMIETYETPSRKSGYSFAFDVNDDSVAEYYAEFGSQNMYFHGGEEQNAGKAEPIIYDFRRLRIFRLKYFVGEVVEARVPLDYLGNPANVSICAQTNIWNLYNEGYNLTRIYIDSACCGKIDNGLTTKQQSGEKKTGIGAIAIIVGFLLAIGYLKRKKNN